MPPNSPQDPSTTDPKPQGPTPEFPHENVDPPGSEAELTPRADHGEDSYRGLGRLTDKVALITGGDSGIGRAVALAFAREGADVAISRLPAEEQDAQETRRWIEDAGRRALTIPGDICEERHCVAMITRVRHEFGRLNILVNNAAFQMSRESIEEISTEEFDRGVQDERICDVLALQSGIASDGSRQRHHQHGLVQAYDPSPTLLAYAATKAAIVNFTKALSQAAMKRSVRVNAVAPGPVWTPLIPSTMPESTVKKFGADTAFGRPAQPVGLAPLFVFLASNEARFVTGEGTARLAGKRPFEFHLAGRVQGQHPLRGGGTHRRDRGGGMPVPEPEDVTVRIPSTNTNGEYD